MNEDIKLKEALKLLIEYGKGRCVGFPVSHATVTCRVKRISVGEYSIGKCYQSCEDCEIYEKSIKVRGYA